MISMIDNESRARKAFNSLFEVEEPKQQEVLVQVEAPVKESAVHRVMRPMIQYSHVAPKRKGWLYRAVR